MSAATIETLFEDLTIDLEDQCPPFAVVAGTVDDLQLAGYLQKRVITNQAFGVEKVVEYSARPRLTWMNIVDLADPLKKKILCYFLKAPHNISFVLVTTQKGKSHISANIVRDSLHTQQNKIVHFVLVPNDKTLADQAVKGFEQSLGDTIKTFLLSSNTTVKLDEICYYIDAYASDVVQEYAVPVIFALVNDAQVMRITQICDRILSKVHHLTHPSPLRYNFIIDECDKTYPPVRPLLLKYFKDAVALHGLCFISATDGTLLATDDYEECCKALMYHDETESPNYRAMHTSEVVLHLTETSTRYMKSNAYAAELLRVNAAHFFTPLIIPATGERYFRKVIVNGNTTVCDMEAFALEQQACGAYVITFNHLGLKLYGFNAPGEEAAPILIRMKGRKLNEYLMCLYTQYKLHDRPLFVIGRHKVDRGLVFQWAPANKEPYSLDFHGQKLQLGAGGAGLIFTDMILGVVEDVFSAVQKAGRLSGKIAQCPQYPGVIHYWTNQRTAQMVINHNLMVDAVNKLSGHGVYSALQATTKAKEQVKRIRGVHDDEFAEHDVKKGKKRFCISEDTFPSFLAAKAYCENTLRIKNVSLNHVFDAMGKPVTNKASSSASANAAFTLPFHIRYRNKDRLLCSDALTRSSDDLWSGVGSGARIMPVNEQLPLNYIVLYAR